MRLKFIYTLLIFSIFLACTNKNKTQETDIYTAVPKSSVIIAEIHDIQNNFSAISETQIFKDADSLQAIKQFTTELSQLKNLFSEDTLNSFFAKRKIVLSTSLSGAGKYSILFISSSDKTFDNIAAKILSENYTFKKKTYAEAEVYTFYTNETEKFSLSSYQGILLFSPSINLVEEAIRQINSAYNFKSNPDFLKLYNTANKKDVANIFIKMEEMPSWAKNILPLADAHFIKNMGTWAELDLQINQKTLIMSGLMTLSDKEAYFTKAFENSNKQATKGQRIIPASSGLWISYAFSNAEEYHRKYLHYIEKKGQIQRYQQQISNFNFDVNTHLISWVDNEMGVFYLEGASQSTLKIAYFKFRSEATTEENLKVLTDSNYIEGYRGFIIKKIHYENILPRVYGDIFKGFHKPYYCFIDDFVLFSESEAALKAVINDVLAHKMRYQDESFIEFESKIPAESHIKIIASNPHFLKLLNPKLEGRAAHALEKQKDALSHYKWAALQFTLDNNAAFVNFYLQNEPKVKEEVSREWTALLENPAIAAPQFVYNYSSKKYDVLAQDSNHKIYLFDCNGKPKWNKQLDGPILGNVQLVDAFKNNKLQMVLNTHQSIYMIDRLGRDVEDFPVKLPTQATAPMAVFNYDRARNYRLIVPAGKKLLNYNIQGKEVKGWAFKALDENIISKPQRYSVDGKDVIITLDEGGNLHLLNRKGKHRFDIISELQNIKTPFYLREGDNLKQSELLCINEKGQMLAIGFNGAIDALYLDEDKPADNFLFFENNYIFSSDNHLVIKSDEHPWTATLENDITGQPKAMILQGEFYTAAYIADSEQIIVFNQKGEPIKGFPVYAQGAFDMGSLKQDGAINIVSTTKDGTLICYRVR